MKKLFTVILLVLIFQTGYNIIPVLSQNEQDAHEIRSVIQKFFSSCMLHDLDSAMNAFSPNYSCVSCEKVKDYNTFKAALQELIDHFSKIYTDITFSDIKFNNLHIQDNNATVEVSYNWGGFNLDTLKEDNGKIQRNATLAKENGSWKITQWRELK